jgi:hypothetical protein
VTFGLALDEEEREFAAVDTPETEVTCVVGGPAGRDAEPIPVGISALFKRARAETCRFELVPAERSLVGSPPGGGIPGRVADMLRLSTHVKKYAGLPRELVELARDKSPIFDQFRQSFDRLSPLTKCLGLRRGAGGAELIFQRRRATVGFGELGLDEHQYVLFAGLAATRRLTRSIVLVDQPELYLSERAAKELAQDLPDVFGSDNLVILGTRSGAIADATPASHLSRVP